MANWVTLPNGVHIDLDDPNNPITGDGSFESYLGGGDKSTSNESRSIAKYLDKNGRVTDASRAAYEKHMEKYYKEAEQIVEAAGFKNENLSYAHALKIDYAKGNISEKELIAGFSDKQSKFEADPTMSGKHSKSFYRDLEIAYEEFDGDMDAILDALHSTGKDYGMSNDDMEEAVESLIVAHGTHLAQLFTRHNKRRHNN